MIIKDAKDYLPEAKQLILDYVHRLDRDLSFQGLDEELDNLENKYLPPNGEMLVAIEDGEVCGMVAYYKHTNTVCEMKRLYVKPEMRGKHIGDALISEILILAKNNGFKEILLDTITPLKPAIGLYEKHGFVECEAYYSNPMDDVIYMKKDLI